MNQRPIKAASRHGSRELEMGWIRNPDARINLTPTTALRETKRGPRPTPTAGAHGAKISISLFASDLARLEAIRSYMTACGYRVSTAQAVKLALRTAPLSEDLIAALVEIRREDGRAQRKP